MRPTAVEALNLVFVHLGGGPSRHLLANLRSTRLRFPGAPITLVVDNECSWHRRIPRGIRTFRYVPEAGETRLAESVTQDMGFRKGFWFNTSRRFLALAQIHEQLDKPVLHIESDVALLRNPAAPLLASGRRWAYSLTSDAIGVGALVFSDSAESSRQLADFFLDYFAEHPGTSDMYTLGAHFLTHRGDVLPLPGVSEPDSRAFRSHASARFRRAASEAFTEFGGVFDAASLGSFLFGEDARNHRGFRKLFRTPAHSDLDYSMCEFRRRDGLLELTDSDHGWVPVYSLHVHSKRIALLSSPAARARSLDHYCRLAEGDRLSSSEFDPWAFAMVAREAILRRVSTYGNVDR
jgi:hypothetical protein